MKLIVHIGGPKTGSTNLQDVLHQNRTVLMENGILFPEVLSGHPNHLFAPFLSGFSLKQINSTQNLSNEIHLASVKRFESEIVNGQFNTVIISSETLSAMGEDHISNLHGYLTQYFTDIRLITYIRHPLRLTCSQMIQHVKDSEPLDFDYFSDEHYRDGLRQAALSSLESFARVFGHENITTYLYQKDYDFCWDVCEHFCQNVLGISSPKTADHEANRNETMSLASAFLLAELQYREPAYNKFGTWKNPKRSMRVNELLSSFDFGGAPLSVPRHLEAEVLMCNQIIIDRIENLFGLRIPELPCTVSDANHVTVDKDFFWNFIKLMQSIEEDDFNGKSHSNNDVILLSHTVFQELALMANALCLRKEQAEPVNQLPSERRGVLQRDTECFKQVIADFIGICEGEVVIYGVGHVCDLIVPFLVQNKIKIKCFIDRKAERENIDKNGLVVRKLASLEKSNRHYIIVCSYYYFEEISQQIFDHAEDENLEIMVCNLAGIFDQHSWRCGKARQPNCA
ncbi:hypothetical protein OAI23_01035 [Alphaproteobacteria bacterium]|nr:hypothetical protein [Alphaproteobacteria bacterium]MDC1120292.1 hypothetical protein [Alphaproteobacteria bacterium]